MDMLPTLIAGKYRINIINFDDWLHKQGYTEEQHGSMSDYIELVYGKPAAEFIEGLC